MRIVHFFQLEVVTVREVQSMLAACQTLSVSTRERPFWGRGSDWAHVTQIQEETHEWS